MTAYYILATGFGVIAALISAYGIWGPGKKSNFPGALSVPLMLLFLAIAVATLTALTIGAGNEHEDHDEAGEKAALIVESA